MDTKTAFISYVHWDGERSIRDVVRTVADKLNVAGIDCELDQYHEDEDIDGGWPMWMLLQSKKDRLLVVCTEALCNAYEGMAPSGRNLGAVYEGVLAVTKLYFDSMDASKVIPIGFGSYDQVKPHIPLPLAAHTYYDVSSQQGFEALLRLLQNRPD